MCSYICVPKFLLTAIFRKSISNCEGYTVWSWRRTWHIFTSYSTGAAFLHYMYPRRWAYHLSFRLYYNTTLFRVKFSTQIAACTSVVLTILHSTVIIFRSLQSDKREQAIGRILSGRPIPAISYIRTRRPVPWTFPPAEFDTWGRHRWRTPSRNTADPTNITGKPTYVKRNADGLTQRIPTRWLPYFTKSQPRRGQNNNKRSKQLDTRLRRCHDTIRDAILTCARKPTWASLIYRTEPTTG